ncbi:MAPEG family protein [Sphingobium sp. Sx8-8]|uniref:MAPEG family protein n=1 Tax=Sphingobium sp. Sx8-8 TaxID=2933617 RepID=UPI001F583330|nr:MAPEG family protein [Sphingobium sp. Sx8-8]
MGTDLKPEQIHLLAPLAVLVLWTLVMMIWMTIARSRGMAQAGVTPDQLPAGMQGDFYQARIRPEYMWPGQNYNHLFEQPTIFYAIAIALILIGPWAWDVRLAWIYVGLRILHSIWQSFVNTIYVRFTLFFLSSVTLALMAAHVLHFALRYG